MRLLFATVSPAHYMAPPSLADEQIVCGPDWPDACDEAGRWRSLKTPVGEYDLATVLARLPADQQPDAVVALVDASWRHKPLNLAAFAGPKAVLVADTHHLRSPLIGMLSYLASEPFDRIVFLYDRHHVPLFQSAGLANVFWFPGLTFPHRDAAVHAARQSASSRAAHLAFVGQTGKHHPRRARLVEALRTHAVPFAAKALPQAAALAHYGRAQLGFNASLNADLNLRIFEILASGAALLTDRLAPASGMFDLWTDNRHLLTYGSPEELAERAAHALAHPAETAAIGAGGAAWFDAHFNEAARRAAFQALLFEGTPAPAFALPAPGTTRVFFDGNTDRLLQSLMVYEGLQEMHRQSEQVHVALGEKLPTDVAAICATLPRVVCGPLVEDAVADMAIFSREAPEFALASTAPHLWCCDAQPGDHAILAESFGPAGFHLASQKVAVLSYTAPVTAVAAPAPSAAPVQPEPASLSA